MKKQAFTLVELIVVITILAILSTISFITLSGYSKEARDSKRISDTRNLLTKINVEQTKGRPLSELIINTRLETTKILGVSNSTINTFGKINFDSIKEDSKLFKDPSLKTQDYPVAYAIGGTGSGAYKFFEIATISEKENTTKVMGNYYKLETDDAESLFLTGGLFYKEGDVPIYNVNGGAVEIPVAPVETPYCNTTIPSGTGIESTNIGSPTQINQAWQEGASSCGYICKPGYSGTNCSVYNKYYGTAGGTLTSTGTLGLGCTGTDILIKFGDNTGLIMAGCNSTIGNYSAAECSIGSTYCKGRYYTWSNAPSACPSPRRLPTQLEFQKMIANLGWATTSPTNTPYFFTLGGGDLGGSAGTYGGYWSSTQSTVDTTRAYLLLVRSNLAEMNGDPKSNAILVRCVKD